MNSNSSDTQLLAQLDRELSNATSAQLPTALARRRKLIEALANQPGTVRQDEVLSESGLVRARLLAEMNQLRIEIRELEKLRRGLRQFAAAQKPSRLVNVRG